MLKDFLAQRMVSIIFATVIIPISFKNVLTCKNQKEQWLFLYHGVMKSHSFYYAFICSNLKKIINMNYCSGRKDAIF